MLFGYIESQPLKAAGFFIVYLLDGQYSNNLFLDKYVCQMGYEMHILNYTLRLQVID